MQFISAIICLPLPLHMSYLQSPRVHKQEPTEHVRSVIKSPIWQARCCLYPLRSHPQNHRRNMSPLPGAKITTEYENGKSCANICVAIFINIKREVQMLSLSPYFTRFNLWCWQVGIRNLQRWQSQDRGYAKEEDLRWEITAEMRIRSHGVEIVFLSV